MKSGTGGVAFTKMQGCGNDFVVLHDAVRGVEEWQEAARPLLDRRFGVGADGLLVVRSPQNGCTEVVMINPDGSLMGMCGNGIRCVTRFMFLAGLTEMGQTAFTFCIEGRRVQTESNDGGRTVRVSLGVPCFDPERVPVASSQPVVQMPFEVLGQNLSINCVSMGNPHCVIFVESIDRVDCETLGPAIENHRIFPKRTNVEFVEVRSPEQIAVRVWERGAGITLACGTGACASVVAASRLGLVGKAVQVKLPGGDLSVVWEGEGHPVFLTGPAREVFSGVVS